MSTIHAIIQSIFDVDPYLGFAIVWACIYGAAWGIWRVGDWLSWKTFGY